MVIACIMMENAMVTIAKYTPVTRPKNKKYPIISATIMGSRIDVVIASDDTPGI